MLRGNYVFYLSIANIVNAHVHPGDRCFMYWQTRRHVYHHPTIPVILMTPSALTSLIENIIKDNFSMIVMSMAFPMKQSWIIWANGSQKSTGNSYNNNTKTQQKVCGYFMGCSAYLPLQFGLSTFTNNQIQHPALINWQPIDYPGYVNHCSL